jgi:hypothetical protein
MPIKTAEERRERSRIAAEVTLSRHDPHKLTEAARATAWAKYERQVDPHGELDPEERHRRARHAMRADLARMNLRKLQAQRQAQEAAQDAADRVLIDQLVDAAPGGAADAN